MVIFSHKNYHKQKELSDLKHIDAVITWIDGNDPKHRKKRLKTLGKDEEHPEHQLPTGKDKTRFVDNGELKHCIASIRKFAPWIRNIYILTDNQKPEFLSQEIMEKLNIQIIDHKEVFRKYEWALPTFNSRTIETAIWRIKDLAPRFIYFNDDVIITKRVKPTHFFKNDNVVLRGDWNKMSSYGPIRIQINNYFSNVAKKLFGITRSMNLLLQIRSAQLAGFENRYFRAPHVPHPIRKSTLKQFFDENPNLFRDNIKFKFRNLEQFNGIYLANHLEIRNGAAKLKDTSDIVMLNGEMDFRFNISKKIQMIRDENVRFACLQGFEKFKKDQKKAIDDVLNSLMDTDSLF